MDDYYYHDISGNGGNINEILRPASYGHTITSANDSRLIGIPGDYIHPRHDAPFSDVVQMNDWHLFDDYFRGYKESVRNGEIEEAPPEASYIKPPQPVINDTHERARENVEALMPGLEESFKDKPYSILEEEKKKDFNPDDFPGLFELFPEYKEARKKTTRRLKKLARETKESMVLFEKLNKAGVHQALAEVLDDFKTEFNVILGNRERLNEEIRLAEIKLEARIKESQKSAHEATGVLGTLKWLLKEMTEDLDPNMNSRLNERDILTDFEKLAFRDLTVGAKKEYKRLAVLMEDLEGLGIRDMMENLRSRSYLFMDYSEDYEEKRRALYAKIIKTLSSRNIENKIRYRKHAIRVQEFLLEDIRAHNARISEYELFMDAFTHLFGESPKPPGMSQEDWIAQQEPIIEEEAAIITARMEEIEAKHKRKWWQKAQKHTMLQTLKQVFQHQEYPGNIKNINERRKLEYELAVDELYDPNPLDLFFASVKTSASAFMELVYELLPLIPGSGIVSSAIEKASQVATVVVENTFNTWIGQKIAWASKGAIKFTLMFGLSAFIKYQQGSLLDYSWLAYISAMYFGLDKHLVRLLVKLTTIIPGIGWAGRWMENLIDFSDPNANPIGKLAKKATAKNVIDGLSETGKFVVKWAGDNVKLNDKVNEVTPMVNALRSRSYQREKMAQLGIMKEINNRALHSDVTDLESKNFKAYRKPTLDSYTLDSISKEVELPPNLQQTLKGLLTKEGKEQEFTKLVNELGAHLSYINPRIRNPADAWKKTFNDAFLNDSLKNLTIGGVQKLNFDGTIEDPEMKKIRKEAAKYAERSTRIFLNTEMNHEGIPTVEFMKQKMDHLMGKYKIIEKRQEKDETKLNLARKNKDYSTEKKIAENLKSIISDRYKLLYEMSFFHELAEISETNHDEFGKDLRRAAVFLDQQLSYNSFVNPKYHKNVQDYNQLYQQRINEINTPEDLFTTEWASHLPLLQELHKMDSEYRTKNNDQPMPYDLKYIAAKLDGIRDEDLKRAKDSKFTEVNLENLGVSSMEHGGYLEMYGHQATNFASAMINFTTNLVGKIAWMAGLVKSPSGWMKIIKTGFAIGAGMTTLGLGLDLINNTGYMSVIGTHMITNAMLVPAIEAFFGQTYMEMQKDSQRIQKSLFAFDDQQTQRREAKYKQFTSSKARRLDALRKKKYKYTHLKARSRKILDDTIQRFGSHGGITSVKKIEAAEGRWVSEDVQYENLIVDIEREIKEVEAEEFDPSSLDVAPGVDKKMEALRKAYNHKTWGLWTIEKVQKLPQIVNWITMARIIYNINVYPESFGFTTDSSGRTTYKYPKPIYQKERGLEMMDDALGINQVPAGPITEDLVSRAPDLGGDLPIPPEEITFAYDDGTQVNTSEIHNAFHTLQSEQGNAAKWIDENLVMVDMTNKKIYENPSNSMQLKIEDTYSKMDPGTEMKLEFAKEFEIFDRNSIPIRSAFDPDYQDLSIFERYPDFEQAPPPDGFSFPPSEGIYGGKTTALDRGDMMPPIIPPSLMENENPFARESYFSNSTMSRPREEVPEPFIPKRSILDEEIGNASARVKVRLFPKAIFQYTGDLQKGGNSEFYDKFFGFLDSAEDSEAEGAFSQLVERFTRMQINTVITKPLLSTNHLRSTVSAVFGDTMKGENLVPETAKNIDLVEQVNRSRGILPRLNFFNLEPGKPYTKEETDSMRVVDAFWIVNALTKKFGEKAFQDPIGLANINMFLQSKRDHHNLQHFLIRQKALETATWLEYGNAMLQFGIGWLRAGMEYDYENYSARLKLTGSLIANLSGAVAPEGIEDLLVEINRLQDTILELNKAIATASFHSIHMPDSKFKEVSQTPMLKKAYADTKKLITHASSKGYDIFAPSTSKHSAFNTVSGHVPQAGSPDSAAGGMSFSSLSVDDLEIAMLSLKTETAIATLKAIAVNIQKVEDELLQQKLYYNMANTVKIISIVGHEIVEKVSTATSVYLDEHANTTNQLFVNPLLSLLGRARGVPSNQVTINPTTALVTGVFYMTFEQVLFRSKNTLSAFMSKSKTAGVPPFEQFLSDVIPNFGKQTAEQMSMDPNFDWGLINQKSYTQESLIGLARLGEYFVEQSRNLSSFDPDRSNVWYAAGKTMEGLAYTYKGAVSAVNMASDAVDMVGSVATQTGEALKTISGAVSDIKETVVDLKDISAGSVVSSVASTISSAASYPFTVFSSSEEGGGVPSSNITPVPADEDLMTSVDPEYEEVVNQKLQSETEGWSLSETGSYYRLPTLLQWSKPWEPPMKDWKNQPTETPTPTPHPQHKLGIFNQGLEHETSTPMPVPTETPQPKHDQGNLDLPESVVPPFDEPAITRLAEIGAEEWYDDYYVYYHKSGKNPNISVFEIENSFIGNMLFTKEERRNRVGHFYSPEQFYNLFVKTGKLKKS